MKKFKEVCEDRGARIGILFIFFILILWVIAINQPKVVFRDDKIFEYGEVVSEKGVETIVDLSRSRFTSLSLENVQTMSVGEKTEELTVKNHVFSKKVPYTYIVKDTVFPELVGEKTITVLQNSTILWDDHFKAMDPVDGDLKVNIVGEYDLSQLGVYPLIVNAIDKNGNEGSADFELNVVDSTDGYTSGYQENVVKADSDSELILVNKSRPLSSSFIPKLKDIPRAYSVGYGYEATPNTVEAFVKMVDALEQETGLRMVATSAYRDYFFQEELYNEYVATRGQIEADLMSARPGYSEHQTGLVIDVVTPGGYMFTFGETSQSIWVNNNAHKYGFIVRYKEEKVHVTGYQAEPWHLRYVGEAAATAVHNQGVSLDEYLQ